jgi:hypothetical protein
MDLIPLLKESLARHDRGGRRPAKPKPGAVNKAKKTRRRSA